MNTATPPTQPSEARRALWVLPVLLAAILAIGPSDILSAQWWRSEAGAQASGLLLAILAGCGLAALLGREIYRLQTSQNSLLKDAVLAAGTATTLMSLIVAREIGFWLWSFEAADVLVTAFLATLFAITLVTERTKGVRVYAYARRFVYFRRGDA